MVLVDHRERTAVPNTTNGQAMLCASISLCKPTGAQQNADGVFNASEDDAAFHHPRRELEKAKAKAWEKANFTMRPPEREPAIVGMRQNRARNHFTI
jgi:hypothetical protein